VVKASASRTVNLTKPDFKFAAARFVKWRRKKGFPKKPKLPFKVRKARRWTDT
jgi:hypothetical protein